jgi:protein-S-isoprenylcysteine O-methyltransferase Ste14
MADNAHDHPQIHKKIHPPVVALFYILAGFGLGYFLPLAPASSIAHNLGFGLTCMGFLLGLAAFIEFRKARTTLDPHGSVTQVVTSGIYRFTRNPIYLGFLLIVIGLPLYSGFYWGILMAPLFVITMNRLVIEREEAYLGGKFGEAYINYKSRVRRWL